MAAMRIPTRPKRMLTLPPNLPRVERATPPSIRGEDMEGRSRSREPGIMNVGLSIDPWNLQPARRPKPSAGKSKTQMAAVANEIGITASRHRSPRPSKFRCDMIDSTISSTSDSIGFRTSDFILHGASVRISQGTSQVPGEAGQSRVMKQTVRQHRFHLVMRQRRSLD